MAKKIRFPLEMKDGVLVRTYEEFIEHFDLEKALAYIQNGKLEQWLRDRSCAELADKVAEVSISDNDVAEKVSGIFGIEVEVSHADVKAINKKNEKKELLKNYTDDKEIFDSIDCVALEQQDVYELLEQGEKKIYLAGEQFEIPLDVSGVTYIGVNEPIVKISSEEVVDWKEKEIVIDGCVFDEKYAAIEEENLKIRRDIFLEYTRSSRKAKVYRLEDGEFKELDLCLSLVRNKVPRMKQRGNKLYYINTKNGNDCNSVGSFINRKNGNDRDFLNEYNIDTGENRVLCASATWGVDIVVARNNKIFVEDGLGICGVYYDLNTDEVHDYGVNDCYADDDYIGIDEGGEKLYFVSSHSDNPSNYYVHEYNLNNEEIRKLFKVRGRLEGIVFEDNKLVYLSDNYYICVDVGTGEKIRKEISWKHKGIEPIATIDGNNLFWLEDYYRRIKLCSLDLVSGETQCLIDIQNPLYVSSSFWMGEVTGGSFRHMGVYDGYIYIDQQDDSFTTSDRKPLPSIRVNIETGEVQMLKNHKYVSL